jgi:hypothetical protein
MVPASNCPMVILEAIKAQSQQSIGQGAGVALEFKRQNSRVRGPLLELQSVHSRKVAQGASKAHEIGHVATDAVNRQLDPVAGCRFLKPEAVDLRGKVLRGAINGVAQRRCGRLIGLVGVGHHCALRLRDLQAIGHAQCLGVDAAPV